MFVQLMNVVRHKHAYKSVASLHTVLPLSRELLPLPHVIAQLRMHIYGPIRFSPTLL